MWKQVNIESAILDDGWCNLICIHTSLLIVYNRLRDMEDLENKTRQIFNAIPTFTPYFVHIGMNLN